MDILIIDGQGGGIGKGLVERLRRHRPGSRVIAAGTNALATSAMLRAGADAGVTGENAIMYNCARAGVIAGPLGIVLANAMLGELSPAVARAVAESPARRVLVPVGRCRTAVAGIGEQTSARHLDDAVELILQAMEEENGL